MKIIVESEEEKQQLLEASEHIHYLEDVDTSMPGVNVLCHLYLAPELIVVEQPPDPK